MKVSMINSGYDGCSYLRIYLPAVYNGYWMDRPNLREARLEPSEIRQQLQNSDVVVFHRAEEKEYHTLAKMLKKDGKKIVMDNDDTFYIEDGHPLAQFTPDGKFQDNLKRRQDSIDNFIKMCDLVTTTTKTLQNEYLKINDKVIILPNYVDPFDWDEPLRNETRKVRIGIVGSVGIEYDYLHIKSVIKELSERDNVEIVLFALGDFEHRKNNQIVTKVFKDEYDYWDSIKKVHFPWVRRWQYNDKLNEARLDMMLIPRRDNYFNRCKSNVKFLEAAMCEIPVIAQSFIDGPYEEITTDMGILIKDNNDWLKEIDRLINDKKLRRDMGKKAKEYAIKNYNIEDHCEKWDLAYKKLFI